MIEWNHTVRVHRPVDQAGAYGSNYRLAPQTAPTSPNAFPDMSWSGDQVDVGGEMQGAKRRWFLAPSVAAVDRDVLDVISGREAPQNVRVVSCIPVGPPGYVHHLEAIVETYTGELIAPDEEPVS